ncbi:VOC family protein [Myxococcota bacterium]|nr:VOC family protein [Myxococcota bacterium]
MLTPGKRFGKVVQTAYLVPDIDAAMEHWVHHAGLGPFTCYRNIELDSTFEGRTLELQIHEALAYAGDLQIQLVQSLNPAEEATPYQRDIGNGRYGLHHLAFFSEDIDRDIETARAQGFERVCVMRGKDGHRYAYCGSAVLGEVWIEFLEVYPQLTEIFASGIAAAEDWDGSDPIRNIEYADL